MSDKIRLEIAAKNIADDFAGDIGELDYAGITLNAMDGLIQTVCTDILKPAVKAEINRVTGETERHVKVERAGFFNPNGKLEPIYKVTIEDLEHPVILEYGYGGRNAFMRPATRRRKTKSAISSYVKKAFGDEWKGQARGRRIKKK